MEYLDITVEDIKNFLRNHEKLKIEIHDKIYTINREIHNTNDVIEMVSFQHAEISDMPKGGGNHKDLADVYLKYEKILNDRRSEYTDLIYELIQKEISVDRVWQCYLILAEPYYSILTELYVKEQKYEVSITNLGCSRRAFEVHRKKAVDLVLELYKSERTIGDLCEYALVASKVREVKKKPKELDENDYQLSMEDYMRKEEGEN